MTLVISAVADSARYQAKAARLSPDRADDVGHEALLELFRLPPTHEDILTFEAFRTACHRRCRNAARRYQREDGRAGAFEWFDPADRKGGVWYQKYLDCLEASIDRELFLLHFVELVECKTLEGRLGLTKWRVHRELQRVTNLLRDCVEYGRGD